MTRTRVWLSALSIPPQNHGQSVFPLFSLLPHGFYRRAPRGEGYSLSFMYCVHLSYTTECLGRCSANMPSWRQHLLLAAPFGAGVRVKAQLLGDGILLLVPNPESIFHFLAPSRYLSLTSHPSTSAQAPRERLLPRGWQHLGVQGPWSPRFCPSVRRASFPSAWSPAGIDVKRRRIAAYRRLTWTLLHTLFLPCPLPLPCTRALARYKRRELGVPQQRRVSAPWRALAFGCCPSWVPLCCCCYLCWAPVPRRTPSSSPEPWTSTPPWMMSPMRRSWLVSPRPWLPCAAAHSLPLYEFLLSSLLSTPVPRVRARGDEPQDRAPAVIQRPSRAHGLPAICRANLLSPLLRAPWASAAPGPAVSTWDSAH